MALAAETIDDEIASDWKAIQEKYAVEPEPETPAPAEAAEAAPALEPPTPERARDESGKFVKADPAKALSREEPAAKETPKAAAPAVSPEPAPSDAGVLPEGSRDINRPPSTWKPTARAEWEKIPPAVRTEIHRRESDFLNGQSQLLPDAKFGKAISEVVAPYRMLIEADGGTPERAIGDLLRTAAVLRVGTPQQKTQAIAGVIRQFNVDMSSLMPQPNGQPAPQPQTFQDPRVDQLMQQMQAERQQRTQQELQSLETSVVSWMNEKDGAGNPARPYLGDVMERMQVLVPQIRQQNPSLGHAEVLQQAYESAIWGNPEIRTLLQQQEAQRTAQTREADNQNRVREARRAASVNVPRRASTPSPGKPGRLEDTIAETARELGLIT